MEPRWQCGVSGGKLCWVHHDGQSILPQDGQEGGKGEGATDDEYIGRGQQDREQKDMSPVTYFLQLDLTVFFSLFTANTIIF